jgi:hypothetical protein
MKNKEAIIYRERLLRHGAGMSSPLIQSVMASS